MSFRYIFITQEDPFYVRLFFEEFLSTVPDCSQIAGVVIAPTMGRKTVIHLGRQMLDFYGPVDFARMGLRYGWHKLAVHLPRTGRPGRFYSIGQVCHYFGVPVIRSDNVNSADFLAHMRSLAPDLIVSVAAPQIFKSELINLPRLGCINIHNSPLPRYRGMLPNFWQMYHGERMLGATVHRINDALDDGPILAQHEVQSIPGESLDAVIRRTKRHGAALVQSVLAQLREGKALERVNVKEAATYFTFPTKEAVREFRRRGYRLL